MTTTEQPQHRKRTTPRRKASATTDSATSDQRVLNVLTMAAGWLNVGEIHAALAAEPAGDMDHVEVTQVLIALVDAGRVERAGLTPPRWRITLPAT